MLLYLLLSFPLVLSSLPSPLFCPPLPSPPILSPPLLILSFLFSSLPYPLLSSALPCPPLLSPSFLFFSLPFSFLPSLLCFTSLHLLINLSCLLISELSCNIKLCAFFQELHPNFFNVAAFSSDNNYGDPQRTAFPFCPSLNA